MELFIAGFLLSLSLCLDLGIVNVAIIRTGVNNGFIKSLNIGLGSTFGDMIYAVLSLLGVSIILKYLIIRWILWIAGTLILIYLCYNMILQIFKPIVNSNDNFGQTDKSRTNRNYFFSGFLLALSSPTAILWFASIGGSVIATRGLGMHYNTVIFLSGFFIASIIWSFILAFISFKGGQIIKSKIKSIFSILSAIIFLILAIYVFMDGYETLIK